MTRLAVIGFGSLIWDLDDLAPHVTGDWQMYYGPVLPLEFSLVSRKRQHALALVIDHADGLPCPTCVIDSMRESRQEAVTDLAARERTTIDNIGFVDQITGDSHSAHETTRETLWDWVQNSHYDGAVWADGTRNFEALTGRRFDLQAAMDHLWALSGDGLTEARQYIHNAPAEVDTPLRRALKDSSWWNHVPNS
jgi:hypothetical protein